MNVDEIIRKKWFRYLLIGLLVLFAVLPGITAFAKDQPFPFEATILNIAESIIYFSVGYLMARSD